ncbi:MAG: hypothetical protein A3I61_17200 [Acidobacteria bacterium RIFCSPLOWO2_02_FULL_68_18]|nr:MAG: hypothetical protein A3I61_17200 [Acidobacteria bacterium RIFCSPLOWO2_02_FULL_68_18]
MTPDQINNILDRLQKSQDDLHNLKRELNAYILANQQPSESISDFIPRHDPFPYADTHTKHKLIKHQ